MQKSSIKAVFLVTLIALFLLSCWYFLIYKNKQIVTKENVTDVSQHEKSSLSEKIKDEIIDEKSTGNTQSITYPVLNNPKANTAIKTFIDEEISIFKENTSWSSNPSLAPAEAQELFLNISYREEKSTRTHAYIFTVATYTGGAHPIQTTKTFSISETGKVLTVADLFTSGEEGLKTISPFVQKELATREYADPSWIAEGAAPLKDNYLNFVLKDSGIMFVFDPYQVAPYTAGMQTVTIPLDQFKLIANPDLF